MLDTEWGVTVDRWAVDVAGERTAVVSDAGMLCYSEFVSAVDHLAEELCAKGIERDECVAVIVPRSPELVVAIHGIMRAGAAYVPIDPDGPALRIRTILEESGARFLVAGAEYADLAEELDVDRIEPSTAGGGPFESAAGPADLAYVIYTSGSTGRPKGVEIEHRSVINRLQWMQRRYALGPDDVILQKTSAAFDVSVWELTWWAMVGASVALLEPGGERDPRKIIAAVDRYGVTVLHFVPSMFGSFLDQLEAQPDSIRRLASLRTVFCSGEVLSPALVERFNGVFGASGVPQLVNLYGPTEATVDVSYFDCPSAGPVEVVPIGKPIDNTLLLVLDERGDPCPVGIPGELNIAGVGLARGYRGRPDLTAVAFVEDERLPGGRRYRTGDLARWRADGNLEFLGRIDDEVKVRGNRVNLVEVQAVMESCAGVRSAVVIAQPPSNPEAHGIHLVGYFVGGSVSIEQLGDHLARRLPAYMVPTGFVELDELPHTASGKLDRRALPRAGGPSRCASANSAPRTAAEAALVDVFASVLGVDSVGVHDDFFTIGGDSILSLAVRTEAERRGIPLDIEELFARPTIAQLAASISQLAPQVEGVTDAFELLPMIDRAALHDAEDAFPATALQLGMLFHSIERADSTMYKDVFQYRLAMPWREAEFATAFERLVSRHPALRSSFEINQHSVPVQVVRAQVPAAFHVVTGAHESDICECAARLHRQSYDFSGGPLYSLRAFVADDGIDLVFAFHHAILDGWSVANLIRELLQDYLCDLGFDVPPITDDPYPATMLAEYVRLEQEAERSTSAHQFWRDALAGSHATSLDFYGAHEPPTTAEPQVTVLIPQWLQDAAQRLAVSRRLPMKSLLLAAHCVSLQRLSDEADVTTGIVTHGRPGRAGAERAAGLFLNTMPIRLDGHPGRWLDVVEQIVRFERAGHRYRRLPLQAIQTDAGRPVVNTVFNFVNYHIFTELTAVTGVELRGFEAAERTNFTLLAAAAMDPRNGRLSLRVTGDRTALTVTQASEYARSFIRVLAAMVRSPEGDSDHAAAELSAREVAQFIVEQAATTPDAKALVTDSSTWTYADLDGCAERLAAGLLMSGMPPGSRVGVMLDRSPEQIVTTLGVLKAGAAVVPLDPAYPKARIDAMIDRARPFRVISSIDEARTLMESPTAATLPTIDPESAAYVLFTSGSTGEPKGVTMPHRALANMVTWQNRRPSGVAGGSTLQFFPLSFDVSFQEIFSTLCGGGTLRLAPESSRRDVRQLVRLVADEGIQRVLLPCGALQTFAETAYSARTRLPTLRAVINVGEPLRVTPEIRWLCKANPGLVLENHYGPTETHEVTSYTLSGPPEDFPTLPPIGTAIDGATIRLLDANRRPVPAGTKGEIYVGGRCLAIGYEARDDLTAQRFVSVGEHGQRMYRTGDLGLQLPSGDLVYLGRADTQVKVRGFRVECAEIEIALMRLGHEAIRSAAVVARDLGGSDSVLVAHLIGDRDHADLGAIRAQLRAVLPEYMIPAHFHWLDEFPLTSSGKRNDKALRELPLSSTDPVRADAAPCSGTERAVADIMAEFAGRPEFEAHTNFFDAGGTSIGAMRVVMAIARTWDVEIPLDAFVTDPTPAHLASLIAAGGKARTFNPIVALRSSGDLPPLFLIHPIGGNVLCYLDLVKHLPADQPVYALQAAGAEPGATPLRTMRDLATSYIAAIRKSHPSGPYVIGGWSFGGYVGVEMARQLADTELERLVLLDTIALSDDHRTEVPESDLLTWFFAELLWQAHDVEAARLTLGHVEADRETSFDSILRQAIEAKFLPPDSSPQLIRRLYEIFHANYEAGLNYCHEPLDRAITLLKSTERMPAEAEYVHHIVGSSFTSQTNGWERLSPRSLTVIEVAGNHLSMMSEPHAADVATKLAAVLR